MPDQFSVGPLSNYEISDQRIDFDVSPDIADCYPDDTRVMTLLMKARKKPTQTTKFEWSDEAVTSWWTQINNGAGYTDANTSFVVDDASIFAAKDLALIPRTGEVILIATSTISTNTITTASRGYIGSAAALNDNDYLVRLGNMMEENSSAPASKVNQPTDYYSFTQIVRTPFDASASNEAEALKNGPAERVRLRRLKLREHKLDLERMFWWGKGLNDTTNKRRAADGVIPKITTYTTNIGGVLTESAWDSFCQNAFMYGSQRKVFVCGLTVAGALNRIAAGKIRTTPGEDFYGMRIKTYESYYGDIDIVPTLLFEKYYAGYGVMLDMANVYYRPLNGRDTTLKQNIQANDVDGWKDEYRTEAGFQVRCEPTHSYLYGVTG